MTADETSMMKDHPNPPKDPIDLPLDEYYDEYVDEYSEDGLRDVLGEEDSAARLPGARTIFKPRERKPSFLLAVLINAFRLIVLSVLVLSLAGVGAVVGVARAYMDTAPELDLTVVVIGNGYTAKKKDTLVTLFVDVMEKAVETDWDSMPACAYRFPEDPA